jgi:hypothetical protein
MTARLSAVSEVTRRLRSDPPETSRSGCAAFQSTELTGPVWPWIVHTGLAPYRKSHNLTSPSSPNRSRISTCHRVRVRLSVCRVVSCRVLCCVSCRVACAVPPVAIQWGTQGFHFIARMGAAWACLLTHTHEYSEDPSRASSSFMVPLQGAHTIHT